MRRQERTRLREWADLVDADLPEEIACEPDTESGPPDEPLTQDRYEPLTQDW